MSIKTVQIVQDDIDGSEGATTIPFAFDGVAYEIDLNETHIAEMRSAIQPWLDRARRSARVGRRGPGARRSAASGVSDVSRNGSRSSSLSDRGMSPKTVREWATANGVAVPDRGRIPRGVVEQYEASQMGMSMSPEFAAPATDSNPPPAPAKKAPAKKARAAAKKKVGTKAG